MFIARGPENLRRGSEGRNTKYESSFVPPLRTAQVFLARVDL